MRWLYGCNSVHDTFPGYRPIDSEAYRIQRQFLPRRFHGNAPKRMPLMVETTAAFLRTYADERGARLRALRDVVAGLVLHTSSHLLGLTRRSLDELYFDQPRYRNAIERVAHYGTSERRNDDIERSLADVVERAIRENFAEIRGATPDGCLVRNIFESMSLEFPANIDEYGALPESVRHAVAMNFASTGLGGMVHSSTNTLDWALARLLAQPAALGELTDLMAARRDVDLTRADVFDKNGPLWPIARWVLHNVVLNPAFGHQAFFTPEAFSASLADGRKVDVPAMSLIVVNYVECNRSQPDLASFESFDAPLNDTRTAIHVVSDPRVASFGGSDTNQRTNRHTRLCPAAARGAHPAARAASSPVLRRPRLRLTPPGLRGCLTPRSTSAFPNSTAPKSNLSRPTFPGERPVEPGGPSFFGGPTTSTPWSAPSVEAGSRCEPPSSIASS